MAINNKRSNYMIDKSFQFNFVVKFIILIVSCAILSGLFLAMYYYITHDIVINNGKEIYVRLVQKKVILPQKQALPADTKTVTLQGMKLAVKDNALYLADGKTLYPTFTPGVFRLMEITRRNRRTLQLEVRTTTLRGAAYQVFRGPLPRFVVRNGVLGTLMIMQGKEVFSPTRAPIQNETNKDEFKNINTKDIKGVYDRFDLIIWPLVTSTLIFILITIVFGIFYSHRLAGPIYRINLSLERILSGDTDFEVRLRKTDAFQHIGERLNALLDRLRSGELGPRKTVVKKAIAKKPAAKKAAVKKTAIKKAVGKKQAPKKAAAKKATAKKAPRKK